MVYYETIAVYDRQESNCAIAFAILKSAIFSWYSCEILSDVGVLTPSILCVYRLLVGWVFFVLFWWQQKHSYPFPLPPSSATCWCPVQDMFPVLSVYLKISGVWCSLSHFPLPASSGSLLLSLPEPFAFSQLGQGQNLLLTAGTPSDVAFLPLLTHCFSPILCLPAWGLLFCLKSSYLDFLLLPTPS